MKRLLFETKVSGKYVVIGIILSLLIIGAYFSYAMFTVSRNKNQAISLMAGTFDYTLTVDNVESNQLVVPGNTTKEFTVVLSNPNDRTARFNFYYIGTLPSNVEAGYKTGSDTPPAAIGVNLESGASQTYTISVTNNSSSTITINLGVSTGLDYNDLSLPSNGHLFEKASTTVAETLLAGVGENGAINTSDPDQTFITGTDPNNYIWYSGKLWRAVSIDPSDNSVKLVTQWNISSIPYNPENSTAFEGSSMEAWLNDTSVDGFLGNLRDYENFIKVDSVWNATMTEETTKPAKTTMVEDAVGLLNIYEYTMSYSETDSSNSYLNNGLEWWTLTPVDSHSDLYYIYIDELDEESRTSIIGVRPSINLKSSVKIVSGDGTENNPYRLEEDNDSNLNGTRLNTRYSGEYIRFGTRENTLYRIVSHETTGLTKITSAEPLDFLVEFGYSDSDIYYSDTSPIGITLNGDYLQNYVGSDYEEMIEPMTTWYLGAVESGESYRLAKYTTATGNELTSNTTSTGVGLLRLGELMAGKFEHQDINSTIYWLLTPMSTRLIVYAINSSGDAIISSSPTYTRGVRPAMNLKQNVIITGGIGTKEDPFTIALS